MVVSLTQAAIDRIKALNGSTLRLFVMGGGCAGLSYKLRLDGVPIANEVLLFEDQGVKVMSDPKSAELMMGTMVHYDGSLNGKGFSFENPSAARSCGCGTSFAPKEQETKPIPCYE